MEIVRIGDGSTGQHSTETIGVKAANLARMAALGLPVPPAFVLPIELCAAILRGETAAKQAVSPTALSSSSRPPAGGWAIGANRC
jgi:pyruvate,orthophosphate dikinase